MKKITLFILMTATLLITGNVHGEEQEHPYILFGNGIEDPDTIFMMVDELNIQGELTSYIEFAEMFEADLTRSDLELIFELDIFDGYEPDYPVSVSAAYDQGHEAIGLDIAESYGLTGQGVRIGVIDTGIDSSHPLLTVAGGVSIIDGVTYGSDEHGHGTHIAGIIAGALDTASGFSGLATGVELYDIRALEQNGTGRVSDLIRGIHWAIEEELDIVNMSLGSEQYSIALDTAVNHAYDQGLLLIAASGNKGDDVEGVQYPAKFDPVIAVGALDHNLNRASFSSFGSELELSAPGVSILGPGLNRDLSRKSGTSMATPFVTGTAALLIELFPDYSPETIRMLLQESAKPLSSTVPDPEYGFGIVQGPDQSLMNRTAPAMPESLTTGTSDESDALDIRIELNWYVPDHSLNLGKVTGFIVYRNGHKLAELSASERQFTDVIVSTTLLNDPFVLYEVTAVNAYGIESVAASVEWRYSSELETPHFSDVPFSHWAHVPVMTLYDADIIRGYPDLGVFLPEQNLTRGQIAFILARFLELPLQDDPDQVFLDVDPSNDVAPYLYALQEAQIINGFTDGTYRPNDPVSRGHIARILARAFLIQPSDRIQFDDVPASYPEFGLITALYDLDIITGYENGRLFRPQAYTTRAQFSKLIYEIMELGLQEEITDRFNE